MEQSPQGVEPGVDRLDGAGYVTRSAGTDDRRAHIVEASGAHAELRAAVWQPVADDAAAAFRSRPPDQLRHLTEDLRRLGELNRTHARRLCGE